MSYGVDASIDLETPKKYGSRARKHDARDFEDGEVPDNIEASLAGENRHYTVVAGETDEDAFEAVFADAIKAYNDSQALKYGRPAKGRCTGVVRDVADPETGETVRMKLGKKALDRMYPEAGGVGYRMVANAETGEDERVPDGYPPAKDGSPLLRYIDRVRADGRDLTQMEEIVLGVGSRDDGLGITDGSFSADAWMLAKERDRQTGGHEAADYVAAHRSPERVAELGRARETLEGVYEQWDELFPNLKLLRFDIHLDEPDGSPHAHVVYVPIATANKNGPGVQCSLEGALREMGFKEGKRGARGGSEALAELREAQRRLVHDCAKGRGLDVTMNKGKGGRKRVAKRDIAKAEELAAETYSAAMAEAGAAIAAMREADAAEAAYLRHKALEDAERDAEDAKAEAANAKREAAEAVRKRDAARRERDAYAGERYRTKDGRTVLGTKGLKAENERLRAEGERIDAANAARSAALDERDRALKAGEERLAEDRAKLDGDRAEATRLLDGYDRPATEADYLPPHDPANIGERVVAEKRAHDDYWAAYHANGHKPPTVHEPGLRETVKVTKEARAGYEQATEEARRERDALREFREGMVELLEDLCGSVKRKQMDSDRKGRKATATFFKAVHGMFVEVLKTLDDAHVPEPPTLDRAAWDEALSAVEAEQARADQRSHATAAARVPAPGIPRETPGWGTTRTPKPSGWDGPSL